MGEALSWLEDVMDVWLLDTWRKNIPKALDPESHFPQTPNPKPQTLKP